MSGGGPKYEPLESEVPDPATLLLDDRKERIDEVVALRTRSVAVVLDRLEDSFNMAAVLRTCEGFGVQDVYVVENPEVRFRPNATVTQGCDKWLTLHTFRGFSECRAALKARGYRVLASAFAPGGEGLFSLRFEGKTALVFGNERHGVSSEVIAESDGTFWIPMRGFTQSFNVSVAVA
ncbi:MAG TPA: RNA methyltransferase, partial [Myxococcaceae bacterium]|nr:RNA methyltransferase [Myxococcaceae bacterium]